MVPVLQTCTFLSSTPVAHRPSPPSPLTLQSIHRHFPPSRCTRTKLLRGARRSRIRSTPQRIAEVRLAEP
ncbi:hypothetical protein CALCODRAFT_504535 [Calocera cornea HHB12733]|uniref:Uncharacterized protein n=1 Tax=Calocera cornea HHB12733 TaxID=1353952 RepID=A0A165CCV0_9BASI|nr:hypothetical protein CALCODRAFT_504535 [Calocera cornea HHB12733]